MCGNSIIGRTRTCLSVAATTVAVRALASSRARSPKKSRARAQLNPNVKLPSTRITPVFRTDSSGTSYNFTDCLAAVSPTAKPEVGVTTQPAFATGVGAKGSGDFAGLVSKTDGAICYLDVAYARQSNL